MSWLYKVKTSKDGNELIDLYLKYDATLKNSQGKNDDLTDFIIYAEELDYINVNSVCLIKMSDAMVAAYYQEKNSNPINRWSEYIYREQKNNPFVKFDKQQLINAFYLELSYRKNTTINYKNKPSTKQQVVSNLFSEASDLFRELKFSRESWDPTFKPEEYLFNSIQDFIDTFSLTIKKSIDQLKKLQGIIELYKQTIDNNSAFIKTTDLFIKSLIDNLTNLLVLVTGYKIISKHHIAFLCGFWDGTIEFLAGILDIILLLLEFQIGTLLKTDAEFEIDRLQLLEILENVIESFQKNPNFITEQLQKTLDDYVESRYTAENVNNYQIAHNAGEDLIMAIDLVVSVVSVIKGLAKLAEKLPKFTDWIDDLTKRIPALFDRTEDAKLRRLLNQVEKDKIKLEVDEFGKARKSDDYTRFTNYSEIKARLYLEQHTFQIGTNEGKLKYISLDKTVGLDDAVRKGIDGVYEFSSPPPKYVITEVKMNTQGYKTWEPKLDTQLRVKSGGRQMDEFWIEYNLETEFGEDLRDAILIKGYESILIGVSKNEDMIIKTLDKNAKVIKDNFKKIK